MILFKSLAWKNTVRTAVCTPQRIVGVQRRHMSDLTTKPTQEDLEQQEEQESVDVRNQRLGIDSDFSDRKHQYVLSFPWNHPEVISGFEKGYKPIDSGLWHAFVNNSCLVDFNILFREFHQYCAIPDYQGLEIVCENNLANYLKDSLNRIHYHGLDVEMANLTVNQPKIELLNVEIHHGLNVTRASNMNKDQYEISSKGSWLGADYTHYKHLGGEEKSFWDILDYDKKPYLLAATVMVESPMKLFVFNQNRSKILYGETSEETTKNVVRFEINLRMKDFFKVLPVDNKISLKREWKITDYNNVLNENPFFGTQ